MPRNSILVIGSSNTDMIVKVARIPAPGETILGGEFATAGGGKGANQAVGAARAGGVVTFIARLGQDMFGDRALAGFMAEGINVDYVIRDPSSPSGVALIFVGKDGENSIAVAPGANGKLTPADVAKAASVLRGASVLVLQLETPLETVEAAAQLAAAAGVKVILNPAPARPLPDTLLERLYLLTPNETEARLLTGVAVDDEKGAARAADALLARGVQNVIITLGARGALVASRGGKHLIRAYKAKVVDTTAAGDIFNGTLAVALAEGKPLPDAVRFATAAAAISVTRFGAQTSAPTRKQIERLLAAGKGRAGAPRRDENRRTRSPRTSAREEPEAAFTAPQ
jgi:ribokinase